MTHTRTLILLLIFGLFGCSKPNNKQVNSFYDDSGRKILSSLGDITTTPPTEWQQFSEPGQFCFHLPPDFSEEPAQGIDSIVKSFKSDDTVAGLDYGIYSQGQSLNVLSGVVDDKPMTIVYDQEDNSDGEFKSHYYRIYIKVQESDFGKLYFDFGLINHVDTEDHLDMPLKIFGTIRLGDQCS